MNRISCRLHREGKFVVAQGIGLDISSFGSTRKEAVANFDEAVALYLEDDPTASPPAQKISDAPSARDS